MPRGTGTESARMVQEVGLALAMGILQQPLLSGGFPGLHRPEPDGSNITAGHSWVQMIYFPARPHGGLLPATATCRVRSGLRWWRLSGCWSWCVAAWVAMPMGSWPRCLSVRPLVWRHLQGAGALAGWWPWRARESGKHPVVLTRGVMLG